MTRRRTLDKLIDPKNSCAFDLLSGTRSGVRIKILFDYIYVFKREEPGASYEKCLVNQIRDPYFHHVAIVGNNMEDEDRLSEIDIDALYFKNLDPGQY